jgi:ribosomal protein S18 acetylase RimI-like enzyme
MFERPFKHPPARPLCTTLGHYAAPMHAVELATPERVPALAAMLGRAFADDPMFVWPLGAASTREHAESFFRVFDERLATLGWLWTTPGDHGVAAWIPPGQDGAMIDIDRELRPSIAAVTPDDGARYEAMWEWIASKLPDEPYWYLDHIAVEAGSRGSGVGTALIQHGLAMAERDGVPAFLETARPENVGYYERRGFRVVDDEDVPDGGPHLWFMSRSAGGSELA